MSIVEPEVLEARLRVSLRSAYSVPSREGGIERKPVKLMHYARVIDCTTCTAKVSSSLASLAPRLPKLRRGETNSDPLATPSPLPPAIHVRLS